MRNIAREGTQIKLCTLKELKDEQVEMFTTVFIGNSQSRIIEGKLVTGRGYRIGRERQEEYGKGTGICGDNRRA